MTTTLRPTEPLQRVRRTAPVHATTRCASTAVPSARSRLSHRPRASAPASASIDGLRIEEPDRAAGPGHGGRARRRGGGPRLGLRADRGRVPGRAGPALRLATALGYVHAQPRHGEDRSTAPRPPCPTAAWARSMTEAEYEAVAGRAVRALRATPGATAGVPEQAGVGQVAAGPRAAAPAGARDAGTALSASWSTRATPVGSLCGGARRTTRPTSSTSRPTPPTGAAATAAP